MHVQYFLSLFDGSILRWTSQHKSIYQVSGAAINQCVQSTV